MAKSSKGKVVAEVGAGLVAAGAAAAAGYYLYGSKNAKKHRATVVKEAKADWKMIKTEAGGYRRRTFRAPKHSGRRCSRGAKKL